MSKHERWIYRVVHFLNYHITPVLQPSTMTTEEEAAATFTLRIAGLGHTITLEDVPSTATIGFVKSEVTKQTNLPIFYQRLLARGTKLEDDDMTLVDAGIKDRTKIMLLHNALYAQEKECYESLSKIDKDIDDLTTKKGETESKVITELVTRICCRLDDVEIPKESQNLRQFRKDLLRKAERIDDSNTSSSDPTEEENAS